jgi:hypothetical protein
MIDQYVKTYLIASSGRCKSMNVQTHLTLVTRVAGEALAKSAFLLGRRHGVFHTLSF